MKWEHGSTLAITRVILSTGEAEAGVLAQELQAHNPALDIVAAQDATHLARLTPAELAQARLVSFCSPTIVPDAVLTALPGPAYNFHPGPPDRPGRFPAVFALYENAPRFGVTVHEMTATVDEGAIVAAEWFDIPPACDLAALETAAMLRLLTVFRRLAPFLALNAQPLPRVLIPWGGTKRTKADCLALCKNAPDLTDAEIALRKRCCGPLFESSLF